MPSISGWQEAAPLESSEPAWPSWASGLQACETVSRVPVCGVRLRQPSETSKTLPVSSHASSFLLLQLRMCSVRFDPWLFRIAVFDFSVFRDFLDCPVFLISSSIVARGRTFLSVCVNLLDSEWLRVCSALLSVARAVPAAALCRVGVPRLESPQAFPRAAASTGATTLWGQGAKALAAGRVVPLWQKQSRGQGGVHTLRPGSQSPSCPNKLTLQERLPELRFRPRVFSF